jgi:hypothetical protein
MLNASFRLRAFSPEHSKCAKIFRLVYAEVYLDPPQARQEASARLFSRVHLGISLLTTLARKYRTRTAIVLLQ